jgi:hypothetical protein
MEITEDKLMWSVLDSRRIEPANWDVFWQQWRKYAGPSIIVKNDPAGNRDSNYAKTGQRTEWFTGLNIYAKDPKTLENGHWQLPYLSYTEIFPNLLDDLYKECPWIGEILYARLWQSTMAIPMHKDYTSEDVTLRAMIYDENEKGTFKVFKPGAGIHYVNLKKDGPNLFVYNNTTCLHGSDKVDGVEKIILLLVHKCKDKQQMLDHLRISAEKYPDQFVYA